MVEMIPYILSMVYYRMVSYIVPSWGGDGAGGALGREVDDDRRNHVGEPPKIFRNRNQS